MTNNTRQVKFLLCVDPDSHQVYTLNLENNEIHIEFDVPPQYRQKALSDINQISNIIQLPSSKWKVSSDSSQRYRRRQFSHYLLHKMIDHEPTYLAQSPMSDAFSNVSTLRLFVNISEYLSVNTTQKYYENVNPLTLEIHVELVTCADELIKKILREVYNIFQVRLKPKSNENQFILQVAGFREYLSGNYPILSYDRVRSSLRGIQFLQLTLKEVPKVKRVHQLFPPIFERNYCDISAGYFSPVPWNQYIDVPILLYYPPYPLPKLKTESKSLQSQQRVSMLDYQQNIDKSPIPNFQQHLDPQQPNIIRPSISNFQQGSNKFLAELDQSPPVFGSNSPQIQNIYGQQNPDEIGAIEQDLITNKEMFETLRPRVLMKSKCLEFGEIRQAVIQKQVFQLCQGALYSGECDWPFKVRVIAITNIHRLLILDDKDHPQFKTIQDQKRRASYNGLCPPRYLTKASAKNEESHNTSKKKIVKAEDDFQLEKKPFLRFQAKKIFDASQERLIQKGQFNPHLFSHGPQGISNMESIATRYELDITPYILQLHFTLMFGQELLTKGCVAYTTKQPFRKTIRFDEVISFTKIKISSLPMEVRLCINLLLFQQTGEMQIIGCGMVDLFDDNGKFRQGLVEINIWPFYKIDTRLACMNSYWGAGLQKENINEEYYCKLLIGLDAFIGPLFWSLRDEKIQQMLELPKKQSFQGEDKSQKIYKDWRSTPKIEELARLQDILNVDPLNRNQYTQEDKYILLKCRHHYKSLPEAFAIFLCAIDWSDPEQIREVYKMLKIWKPLPAKEALPLLDATISDEYIRMYAAQRVNNYKDDELVLFMLQLTQALMFEQQHFSPLGEMLIERSIMNPWIVGHALFWQLRSQLHLQPCHERYCLLLEQLLMLFGSYREELLDEVCVNDEVMYIAEQVKVEKEGIRLQQMRRQLHQVRSKFKKTFQFAIDPRMNASEFIIEKSKILDSKKLPLWLTMKSGELQQWPIQSHQTINLEQVQNKEKLKQMKKLKDDNKLQLNERIILIYKCGDDIRQDLLTLQLIQIMDKIWLDYGIDYRMKPYRVISTLDQVGMIEVVLASETISQIHKDSGTLGALNKSSIMEYLKKFNSSNMEQAIENFLRSCAGYCVATYILGIGDRHSGNIMLTQMGHLFHIDFGHFLGNFKKKYGFKRERAPFVFTEEMAYVMGGVQGEKFYRFEDFCTKAYNQVRKHGHFLLNVFLMTLSAGMPELQDVGDIDYMLDQLSVELGDQEANEKFKKAIQTSLNDQWRKIDNFIHNLKRG